MKKTASLCFLVILAFSVGGSTGVLSKEVTASQILDLVNKDRQNYALAPLKLDPTLTLAALAKAKDMLKNDYFAHISPMGVKPWYYFKALGYDYTYAGENLGAGFNDARQLQSSWMSSESHRDNILSSYYSDLGVAVVGDEDRILVVEFFGSKSSSFSLRQ